MNFKRSIDFSAAERMGFEPTTAFGALDLEIRATFENTRKIAIFDSIDFLGWARFHPVTDESTECVEQRKSALSTGSSDS